MSVSSTWSFDEPASRLTPDEITARAEEYALTGLESCYAGLEQRDLMEFHSELARIKRRDRLGAWRQP